MTYIKKTLSGMTAIMLSVVACNAVAPTEQPFAPEIQTAVLETLLAVTTASPAATGSHPTDTGTAAPADPAVTLAATGTITPTYSVPMITVQEPTNCRTGPGQDYDIVFTYLEGKQLEITGRYEPGDFWLVKSPESPGGTCWMWGGFVEVTGSHWAVASVTPPPTGTAPPPQAPTIQNYEFFCSSVTGQMEISMSWVDRAANESGYRIIRNGEQAATLPPDSTTFTDVIDLKSGQSVTYRIEAFSAFGSASSSTINVSC